MLLENEPQIYLTQEKLESLLGVSLTHEQYLEVRHAVFELASIIIENRLIGASPFERCGLMTASPGPLRE